MRHGAFVPACSGERLGSTPTAAMEDELLDLLVDVLCGDWAGIEVRFAVVRVCALVCRVRHSVCTVWTCSLLARRVAEVGPEWYRVRACFLPRPSRYWR